jgi:hypothetical protein
VIFPIAAAIIFLFLIKNILTEKSRFYLKKPFKINRIYSKITLLNSKNT